ncbi:cell division protein FtsB [Pseudomarimonas salicorniae]|uniref:Cell division protein FtsB n=1 Tax=Pseudomarimonas salicorniae TaxID=2933270 RepID=A0ABT0GIG1_9GAMM|nr:cell division protein FtsB [Lysobacter sp. CAU 1642]MCK7593802.1 cell division protein FtsB [Lysobacter sp. CAU 1642]
MRRLIALVLILMLAGLQAKLWLGEGGRAEVEALRESVKLQRAENKRLEQRNAALGAEVEDLKSGTAAVEERARTELGMIKPGETFYRVIDPPPAAQAP